MLRRRFLQESVPFDMSNYMTIEPLADGLNFRCASTDVEYTTDGKKWTKLAANTVSETFSSGQFISVRSKLQPGESFGRVFINKAQCNLHGNCLSLIFGDYVKNKIDISEYTGVFYQTFCAQPNIISIAKNFLPALKLGDGSYYKMFSECTNLTNAPDLPAVHLGNYCYSEMFYRCTKLVRVPPILPAMNLTEYCYEKMFMMCSRITIAPVLPARILPSITCYNQMFSNCALLSELEIHLVSFRNSLGIETTNFTIGTTQMLASAGANATYRRLYYNADASRSSIASVNSTWTLYYGLSSLNIIINSYTYVATSRYNKAWGSWVVESPYNPGHFYLDDNNFVTSDIFGDLMINSTTRVSASMNVDVAASYFTKKHASL